jgi:hypothetical protein
VECSLQPGPREEENHGCQSPEGKGRSRRRAAGVRRIVKKQVRECEGATTWDHLTFRIGEQIFATLHDNGLILRCSKSEAKAYLRDERFAPARCWERFG